jgi:glutamate-1-semialdehyde 2,1-aminomutase
MTRWERANQIIPGGNHLFSKTPDRYCPGQWPPYYSRAQGIEIEAMDGRRYLDFSVMGAGNSILGYNDPHVNGAAKQAIDCGNVSTLNCPEEVDLAEVVLRQNPGMDMVRFGRSGNDACQIALRIAREYTEKKEYVICGYHGWEIGHPPQLDPRANPIEYGDIQGFKAEMDYEDNACVMMECIRSKPVDLKFLNYIRTITEDRNIPLIFDEIASGYRCNLGGYHQLTNVKPDIALYGKAMGNGFAISAVVGTREIMEAAKNTFISSMFWSERLGYCAGLATIDRMKETNAQTVIQQTGKAVKHIWRMAAQNAGMEIEISGLDPLATFTFVNDEDRVKITTFTQEMLKRGFLASNQFYASIMHRDRDVQLYAANVYEVFEGIANGTFTLEGEPSRPGFTRLA